MKTIKELEKCLLLIGLVVLISINLVGCRTKEYEVYRVYACKNPYALNISCSDANQCWALKPQIIGQEIEQYREERCQQTYTSWIVAPPLIIVD